MVEIHEPLRLITVVEASVERLTAALAALPASRRLVDNRLVHLIALDPSDHRLYRLGEAGYEPYRPLGTELGIAARSMDWYGGKRDHLPFARITSALATPPRVQELTS
jgi:hypothetical protein